jgi:hypothetical protein
MRSSVRLAALLAAASLLAGGDAQAQCVRYTVNPGRRARAAPGCSDRRHPSEGHFGFSRGT